MTNKKKSLVFIIICCCFLTVTVFLPSPGGAQTSGTVSISGTIPLVTYNISVSGIGLNGATVTWNTNSNANSTVEYGLTTGYGFLSTDGAMTEDHTISLSSLLPDTLYHYQVISFDLAGNSAVSTDFTFMTTALPPTVAPTPVINGGGGRSGGGVYGIFNVFTGQGSLLQLGPPEQPQPPGSTVQNTASPPQNAQQPPTIAVSHIISTGIQNAFQGASLYLLFMGLILIALVIAIAAYIKWRRRRNSF